MILNRLHLHPFAGTQDREVEFAGGLNVVLGPNEAGKSTLFNALLHVLLTTTDLTASAFKNALGRFMPAAGGDTIRARLDFGPPGAWIEKSWSPGNRKGAVRLVTAAGAEYTDPATADPLLAAMLPAGPAAVRELLLTRQADISPSGPSLDPGETVRVEIGDMLRRAVMETGGVSVEKFRALVDEQYTRFFNNWDAPNNRPVGGREADNPHRRNVGTILQRYYEMSHFEAQHRETVRLESEVDTINMRLRELGNAIASDEEERNRLLPLREPVRKRGEAEGELRALRAEVTEAERVNSEWPVKEDRLRRLAEEREGLEKRLALLSSERAAAEEAAAARDLLQRAIELKRLKANCEAASQKLASLPPVREKELRQLSSLTADVARLRAVLDASRLTYTLLPRKKLSASVREGLREDSQQVRKLLLEAGEEHHGEAGGSVVIDLPDATLSVRAGGREDADSLESTAQSLSETEAETAALLSRFGAADAGRLEGLARSYAKAESETEILSEQLQNALGEENYEEVVSRAEKATGEGKARPIETIIVEHTQTASGLDRTASEAGRTEEELAGYRTRFGTPRELFLAVATASARIDAIEKSLAALPVLPAGFDTSDAFFRRIDELEEKLRAARENLHLLQQERTRAESAMPEESSEQLASAAAQARVRFERTLKRGRAVELVRSRTAEILAELEDETFVPYRKRFIDYLSRVSGGRFAGARLREAVPESFSAGTGDSELPFDLLSWGTRDLVALALRLVLAEYVLRDRSGFLVLDDPLVDMDPARRRSAAGAIGEFASRYQTIVFTCHPDHAAELGGSLVELESIQ